MHEPAPVVSNSNVGVENSAVDEESKFVQPKIKSKEEENDVDIFEERREYRANRLQEYRDSVSRLWQKYGILGKIAAVVLIIIPIAWVINFFFAARSLEPVLVTSLAAITTLQIVLVIVLHRWNPAD